MYPCFEVTLLQWSMESSCNYLLLLYVPWCCSFKVSTILWTLIFIACLNFLSSPPAHQVSDYVQSLLGYNLQVDLCSGQLSKLSSQSWLNMYFHDLKYVWKSLSKIVWFLWCVEYLFFSYLVEDKSPLGFSYVEFLVHVHRQIQNRMA